MISSFLLFRIFWFASGSATALRLSLCPMGPACYMNPILSMRLLWSTSNQKLLVWIGKKHGWLFRTQNNVAVWFTVLFLFLWRFPCLHLFVHSLVDQHHALHFRCSFVSPQHFTSSTFYPSKFPKTNNKYTW